MSESSDFFSALARAAAEAVKKAEETAIAAVYAKAKSLSGHGVDYVISSDWSGDDRYKNTFQVRFDNRRGELRIEFSGKVGVYKRVAKNALFCTAEAHAQGDLKWSGTIALSVKSGKGAPRLHVDSSFQTDGVSHNSGTNTCADVMTWIGAILGGILDALNMWEADKGLFSILFAQAFSVGIPGIGDLRTATRNLSASISKIVLLPAGQVFNFANPSSDASGNIAFELNYK